MKRRVYMSLCLMVLCLAVPGLTWADITFSSQAGLALTTLVDNAGNVLGPPAGATSVVITAHPAWQQNVPGDPNAVWISNSHSGYGDSQFQQFNITSPIFSLSLNFLLASPGTLNLKVWTDDSTGVTLSRFGDGTNVLATAITTQNPPCSGGVIGCVPQDGLLESLALVPGDYTLTFTPYQTGTTQNSTANPFGLLYSANVTGDVRVPEAGALSFLAFIGPVVFIATKGLRKKLS